MFKYGVLGVALLVALVSSKSIENDKDIVWFPDPNGDGLIPGKLTPTIGAMEGSIEDIHFYLFSKSNKEEMKEIDADDISTIDDAVWQTDGPVKMLIHGFGASIGDFPRWAKDVYVSDAVSENYNIIIVDWSILSASPDYFTAVANAQVASGRCAHLLNALVEAGKLTWPNVHLIGYSLGGQVVGQIGHKVQADHAGKVGRITALDPALPLFDVADAVNKTDSSDADFVDVIHTAANGFLAYWDPIGHIDWYPNGGRYQPGCGVDLTGSCGHSRAPACFIESITGAIFEGLECATFEDMLSGLCDGNQKMIMGEHTPLTATGIYFLETNSASPYAQGPLA